MFHTDDGLRFYRKETHSSTPGTPQVSKTLEVTLGGSEKKKKKKILVIKNGASVLAEHEKKQAKLKSVGDFCAAKKGCNKCADICRLGKTL